MEDILIFRGVLKGPTLGPLGKHKCQGPVQLWGPRPSSFRTLDIHTVGLFVCLWFERDTAMCLFQGCYHGGYTRSTC